MRILLHIGLPHTGADAVPRVLAENRADLAGRGILYPKSPGDGNHTRLFMAVTDPDHVDPLRFNRGLALPKRQANFRASLESSLRKEVDADAPDTLILSASQLGWLARPSELERLRALLAPLSDDIQIIAHVAAPATVALNSYAAQVAEGRARGLDLELSLTGHDGWWDACLEAAPPIVPPKAQFLETQAPPFWLDYTRLVTFWENVFGKGRVQLQAAPNAKPLKEIAATFGITQKLAPAEDIPNAQPSAAALARGRQFNALLLKYIQSTGLVIPRPLWMQLLAEMAVPGDATDPASLLALHDRFASQNAKLAKRFDLPARVFEAPRPADPWTEADPTKGFRAAQYLLHFRWRIEKTAKSIQKTNAPAKLPDLSDTARDIMPPRAIQNYDELRTSRYAPHNGIGKTPEDQHLPPYTERSNDPLPDDASGKVIVGCMKNEAPYILEWVAYHRCVGVDNFLIYTNGCEDGTDEILDRLQELGMLEHRLNDDWKGKSPQQYALNKALTEPVIKNADWLIHIDVDEFINVRCGNGTLDDFIAQVPDATNVAMTWRLFGHNDVTDLRDTPVTEQFDTCAPKFCPKPHTVWGFKTMLKNNGAYAKLSCHRPNKLDPGWKDRVRWVNGSGTDITGDVAEKGWRSSTRSVGYDLLQLNHYALRSAESFLIKRQRGRALHVDRSIGLNYWIRMDWSVHQDITIQRNLPRLKAELARLLEDPVLKEWHEKGLAWHRAKADELKTNPEFRDLFDRVQTIKLTESERVAYALALDMET